MSTKKVGKAKVVQLTKELNWYGLKKSATGKITNQLEIELALFDRPSGSRLKSDGSKNEHGVPQWRHFMNAVDLIWNFKGSQTPFVWHPWAVKMAKAACRHKRLAITSGGSGGKTDVFALYALVSWLAKPTKNVVLVNTTTLKDAMGRVWGRIIRYFHGMIAPPPGKLVSSAHCIKTVNPKNGTVMEEFGVFLFAGEQSKAAESSRAIRGRKHGEGGKLIVIIDEAAEVGDAIVNCFEENLSQNPRVQLIALANANSPFDAFGRLCTPKDVGWEGYSADWDEWEGEGAHVIRINIETSPNILEGRIIYPFLMTREMLEDKREKLGINSRAYWRGVLGAFLLDGDDENIYSAAEIISVPRECVWQNDYTMVAGFDIAYTAGGDRSVLTIGKIGLCTDGKRRLKFISHHYLNEDLSDKKNDRTTQVIKQLREICEREGVLPENLAIDSTSGGGKTFADALWSQWSSKIFRVDFGGKASDRPVSSADREKSSVRYANRVSELWGCGKELIRCNQLVNITKDMAKEMVARKYKDTKAQDGGSRIRVESKIEMKRRTRESPDVFDSAAILIDLCREKHKLSFIDRPGDAPRTGKSAMQKRFSRLSSIYAA